MYSVSPTICSSSSAEVCEGNYVNVRVHVADVRMHGADDVCARGADVCGHREVLV